jgi:biopolymer transport protein ExbD
VGKSGFVVRFVDVVLILLFGFISISSVRATEVELPQSTEAPAPPPEIEEALFVGIRPDGTYLLDEERVEIRGARALLAYLATEIDAMGDVPVKVRIRASRDAPMRYLVDAARVCDELGVPKALEVQMAGGGEG